MAVARLSRRLRQERQSTLTPTQLSVLGVVARIGPATPGAIAAVERVRPPSITRVLNHLVECGYVSRAPHPDDGRQLLIELSAEGDRILADERERRDAWLEQHLAALSETERRLLRDATPILTRLAESE
ncbi:hypothetical protein BHE97_06290 [Aeromicrobium sp. PE09-221]|nr:hypothetical protein BHE97_06290 [Aeromicrobium sp. PE09-221]